MDETPKSRLPIVGIGASAGGIEAFRGFFENMPADSGLGFVVVLHLPTDRKSILPEILSRWTSMRVVEAADGCPVEANCVYVPPPGVVVILRDGSLHLHQPTLNAPREPSPISVFFDSLAVALQEDAIGIVLSGTGNDGALGLKAIKAAGGFTLAQGTDGTAPQHTGMPSSAIATGAVDIVASAEAMPGHIVAMQQIRSAVPGPTDLTAAQRDAARLAICSVLQRQIGHDFSGYKEKTFLRRVQRRMQVIRITSLDAYAARLDSDHAEVVLLFRDLLIGVTSFFRDAEMFVALQQTVVARLFEGKDEDNSVRVWIAGCATGEEAYSLAMVLREYMDTLTGSIPRLQVFATDIDEPAIAAARTARYPSTLLAGISPERLARFFVSGSDGSYTVGKDLRELCTFSTHSLIRDPPFSRIDLVSCRNLLIYLDSELQGVVIPAFHYALVSQGILLLGSSENVSRYENLFATLDRTHRIFQRLDAPTPPLQLAGRAAAAPDARAGKGRRVFAGSNAAGVGARLDSRARLRVLERFGPAFVVVGAAGDISEFSNRTGRYLEAPPGLPSQNVLDMARSGLRTPLRTALRQAVETDGPVETSGVPVAIQGEGLRRVSIAIEPLVEPGRHTRYLIVFVEGRQAVVEDRSNPADAVRIDSGADRHLEIELRDTREQLQSVTEEHETGLEELRSANEELHSVNEELQSANEELETSKEEIQSINEELQTVNNQLSAKVEELESKKSDLQNLFESTQVATVFLDPYLIIRGFTPAVAGIFNLIPSDHGRPLTDIVSRLRYAGLRDDIAQVLSSLRPLERRVVAEDGKTHYLMRILPYRTPYSTVDGTLVTFADVTSIVQAERHQTVLVDELNQRVRTMLSLIISLATQTSRPSGTPEVSGNFLGRLHALSGTYTLLSAEARQTVGLREVILEGLKPFMAGDATNVAVQGPPVRLQPRAALALGLAVHELTTNAMQHGALSVPEGRVSVVWRVEQGAEGDRLSLDWVERGGPPVAPRLNRGLGIALIERGLTQDMSAQVAMTFEPEGVTARLRAPLPGGHEEPSST